MDNSQFCVYIMTNDECSHLYTGWTGNLRRRVGQHRTGNGGVFTRRYNLARLVYYEVVEDETAARMREKQIKRGGKKMRVRLIEGLNPTWKDLFDRLRQKQDTKGTKDTKEKLENF